VLSVTPQWASAAEEKVPKRSVFGQDCVKEGCQERDDACFEKAESAK